MIERNFNILRHDQTQRFTNEKTDDRWEKKETLREREKRKFPWIKKMIEKLWNVFDENVAIEK